MAEMKTFAFVVSFLLIYSAFLSTVPPGLLTDTYDDPTLTEIDPQLVVGFGSYVQYDLTNYTAGEFSYSLGGFEWNVWDLGGVTLGTKVIIFIWIDTNWVEFILESGESRGVGVFWATVQADADNGTTRYTLVNNAITSGMVLYWNPNDYTYCWDAWGNDSLYIIHGVGASDESPQNALSLVLGMLTFSIPGIPFLLQVLLSSPIYASILYLIWFLIKEVIPFL